jgi:hypothetical protein
LRMAAPYPPRGSVGILAAAVAKHVRRSRSDVGGGGLPRRDDRARPI